MMAMCQSELTPEEEKALWETLEKTPGMRLDPEIQAKYEELRPKIEKDLLEALRQFKQSKESAISLSELQIVTTPQDEAIDEPHKHTPFTSEPSHPHLGSIGHQHVDMLHFGEGGRKDNSLTVSHLTDPGHIRLGEIAKEIQDKKKPLEPKKG